MGNLDELEAMGYTRQQATRALEIAGGDLEQAVGFLLMSDESRADLGSYHHSGMLNSESDNGNGNGNGNDNDTASLRLPPHSNNTTVSTAARSQIPGAFSIESKPVDELIDMGYSREVAEHAITINGGSLDRAISFILMNESSSRSFVPVQRSDSLRINSDAAMAAALQHDELSRAPPMATVAAAASTAATTTTTAIPSPSQRNFVSQRAMHHPRTLGINVDTPRMVATDSFLSVDGAGPFGACMAASQFLNGGVVTREFLNDILQKGIELFRKIDQNSSIWDVGRVLRIYGKSHMNIEIALKDGSDQPKEGTYIVGDQTHAQSLRKQLTLCRNQQPSGWQALILEVGLFDCFCIALPPKGTKNKFWYFDLNPRSVFRVNGAHARVHRTLLQLDESLETVMNDLLSTSKRDYESFRIYTIKKVKN